MWAHVLLWLNAAAGEWYNTKLFIEHSVAFTPDAIHVLVGGTCPLVIAWLLRSTVGSWIPWLLTFALAILNELIDLGWDHWPELSMQYGESMKDLLLTMALPTVLLLTVRRIPSIYGGARRARLR